MKLVVDTNIIFSALLRKESKELLVLKTSSFQFFTPKIVFIELFKYKEKILKYTHLQEDEVIELFQIVFEDIKVIDESQIPYGFRKLGYDLTKNVDIKDSFFVSLSLALQAKLWTGDKRLREYLVAIGRKDLVITTHELLNIIAKF